MSRPRRASPLPNAPEHAAWLPSGEAGPMRDTRRVSSERSRQLREIAQRVVNALPLEVAEEVVLTGSVSRGVADEFSDIEMLVVTPEPLDLAACFDHARDAGLAELDTWGEQSGPARRVSGYS